MSPRRTLWGDLRAIDRTVVPRLAAAWAGMRRGAHRLRPAPAAERATVDGPRESPPDGPTSRMRRLDDRYASHGVLGLVRDVPQLGALVIALLLTIAGVTTAVRIGNSPHQDTTEPDLPAVSSGVAPVGPLPNERISDYVTAAQAALGQQYAQNPKQETYAIVDFEKGLTPSEVADALPGVEPRLIYVRVHVTGATVLFPNATDELAGYPALKSQLRVHVLPDDALGAFRALANGLDQAGSDLAQQANTITADQDQQQKAAEQADARHYRRAASALQSGCACIYAVVVHGTPETMQHIVDSGRVRVIDPAAPGLSLDEITWTPLLPETTTRQPARPTSP